MRTTRSALQIALLLLAAMLLLVACGGGEDEATPVPATNTPVPTDIPAPTDTPEPTATVEPTAIPEPTATPDVTANFTTFESVADGFTIEFPQDWVSEEADGFFTLASGPDIIGSADPPDEGAVSALIVGNSADFNNDPPLDLLNEAPDELDLGEDVEFIEPPKATTINGQEAAVAVYQAEADDGTPLIGLMGIVTDGPRTAIYFSASPEGSWEAYRPTVDAILQSLVLTEPAPSTALDQIQAIAGLVGYGETVDGTIPTGGVSAFTFVGLANESIDISVVPQDSDLDVVVDVLDGKGNSLVDGGVDQSFDEELITGLILPETGDYYVVISGYEDAAGDYQLALAESGQGIGAGIPESQGFLLYGDVVQGTVPADGVAAWDFIGLQNEVVDIQVVPQSDDFDVVLDIIGEDGVSVIGGELDESFGSEIVQGLSIPTSGEFYIILRGFAGSSGDYQLSIVESGELSLPDAEGVMAYGDTRSSFVAEASPSQWSFTGSSGDIVDIFVNPSDDLDAIIDVIDANGLSIVPGGEIDDSFDDEEIRDLVLPSTGQYNIIVTGFADSSGDYDVILELVGSAAELPPADGTIAMAGTVAGNIGTGESAVWRFDGTAGEYVNVTVTNITEDLDTVVDVLGPTGVSVLSGGPQDAAFNIEFIRLLQLPTNGDYSIVVTGFDGSTGDYEVTLEQSNMGQVGVILEAFDSLETAEDAHFFPFTANSGDRVSTYVASDFDMVIGIYDDDTEELLDEVDSITSGYEEAVYTANSAGNYYFLITGFEGETGEYAIQLVGPSTTIFELAIGDEIGGRLGEDGSASFWYGGTAGETIAITAAGDEDTDLVIEVILDSEVLAEIDDAFFGEEETLFYTFDSDGLVNIVIRDFFEGQGEFEMIVEEG